MLFKKIRNLKYICKKYLISTPQTQNLQCLVLNLTERVKWNLANVKETVQEYKFKQKTNRLGTNSILIMVYLDKCDYKRG